MNQKELSRIEYVKIQLCLFLYLGISFLIYTNDVYKYISICKDKNKIIIFKKIFVSHTAKMLKLTLKKKSVLILKLKTKKILAHLL